MNEISRYLISPPVGNRFGAEDADRILGSYTLNRRPGRLIGILKTVRSVPRGWINNIGLRNPGIRNIKINNKYIYSLAGIELGDWYELARHLDSSFKLRIELNLSCPNVHKYSISRREIEFFTQSTAISIVIAKLPPTFDAWMLADRCLEAGVEYLHFSNTFPFKRGGISGDFLRHTNLSIVELAAKIYPQASIIAGGGIKSEQHVAQYENAGAKHFSICTGYFQWMLDRKLQSL